VVIDIEGMSDEFNKKLIWPDKDLIDFCGSHILDRDCGNGKKSTSIKILFGMGPVKTNGFILDNG